MTDPWDLVRTGGRLGHRFAVATLEAGATALRAVAADRRLMSLVWFVLISVAAGVLFGWEPLAVPLATDLLHGATLILVSLLILVFVIASPWRVQSPRRAAVYAGAAACVVQAFWFLLKRADLADRDDRLWQVLIAVSVGVVAAQWLGPWALGWWTRVQLHWDPTGRNPLRLVRELIEEPPTSVPAEALRGGPTGWRVRDWNRWFWWPALRLRVWLGLGPSRSYAIERACQRALARTCTKLRRALLAKSWFDRLRVPAERTRNLFIKTLAERTLNLFITELKLLALVASVGAPRPSPLSDRAWVDHWVLAWCLVHDARLAGCWRDAREDLDSLQRRLREAVRDLLGEPGDKPLWRLMEGWEKSDDGRWGYDYWCERAERAVEAGAESDLTRSERLDRLGVLLCAERCVEFHLAYEAIDLLDPLTRVRPLPWPSPVLARVLRAALSQATESAYLNPEERKRLGQQHDALEAEAKISGRARAVQSALRQGRWDPGPGRSVAAVGLAALAAVAVGWWSGTHPLGEVHKPLNDLYRGVRYHDHPLTDLALSGRELLLSSNGDGLHRIDTRTFRIRTERPGETDLSSPWLRALAVAAGDGSLAVVTGSSTDPSQEAAGAQGLDLRLADGTWHTLIGAEGVRPPRPEELALVAPLGRDKVFVTAERLLHYSAARRQLAVLVPRPGADSDPAANPLAGLTAAAQSDDTERVLWVATRPSGAEPHPVGLLRLEVGDDGRFGYRSVSHPLPSGTEVDQLVAAGGSLWVKTLRGELYQRAGDAWTYRMDGDTRLDLGRVRHAILVPGGGSLPAALWLTERDYERRIVAIRVRFLGDALLDQGHPWHRIDLGTAGLAGRLLLDADAAAPVGWCDARAGFHRLLIPRTDSGLEIFSVSAQPIDSPLKAVIDHRPVALKDQRVVSLDRAGERLVLVTVLGEAGKTDTERRVVVAPLADLDRLERAKPLHQAAIPEPGTLERTRLLAVGGPPGEDGGNLVLVTDSARVLVYDTTLHGLKSRDGASMIPEAGGGLERLVGAAVGTDGSLVALAADGRVLDVKAEAVFGGQSLSAEVRHQSEAATGPAVGLTPLRAVGSPSGVDLFFGRPGAPAEPWQLRLSGLPRERHRLATLEPVGPPDQPRLRLALESLTRILDGPRIGPLVALDQDGMLRWRSPNAWTQFGGADLRWQSLFPLVGATFARRSEGIWRIGLGPGATDPPLVRDPPWWSGDTAGLTLPISGAVGLADPSHRLAVLVAHAGGLSTYDPKARTWSRSWEAPKDGWDKTEPWELLCPSGQDGACARVWAVRRRGAEGPGFDTVLQVNVEAKPERIGRPGTPMEAAAAGAALALLYDDGRLEVQSPSTGPAVLQAARSPEVRKSGKDSVLTLRRAEDSESDGQHRLLVLDDLGRVLAASLSDRPAAKDPTRPDWTIHVRNLDNEAVADLAGGVGGAVLYASRAGRLFVETPTASGDPGKPKNLNWPAERVQRVGDQLVAASPDLGRLGVLDGDRMVDVAGGLDQSLAKGPGLGPRIETVLADGDSLYLAGQSGAAYRDPEARRTVAIPGLGRVERFETIGPERVAWAGDRAYAIDGSRQAQSLDGVPLPGPGGALWLLTEGAGLGRKDAKKDEKQQCDGRLLCYEGRLDRDLTQLAPIGERYLLMRGSAGELVYYDLGQRNLRRLAEAKSLPAEWRLVPYPWGVAVVPQGRGPLGRVVSRAQMPPTWEALAPPDRPAPQVVAHADGIAWQNSQAQVFFIGADGKRMDGRGLRHLDSRAGPGLREVVTIGDQTLIGTDGRGFASFDLREGTKTPNWKVPPNPQPGVAAVIKTGKRVLGAHRPKGGQWELFGLSSEPFAPMGFAHLGFGDAELLGWTGRADGHRVFQFIGDQLGKVQDLNPTPPASIRTDLDPVVPPGADQLLYFLTIEGNIAVYDAGTAQWHQEPGGSGWGELGLATSGSDACALALRPVPPEGDGSGGTGRTEVRWLAPCGAPRDAVQSVPGAAWFLDGDLLTIEETSGGERRVMRRDRGGTGTQGAPLLSAVRDLKPFAPAGSRALTVPPTSVDADDGGVLLLAARPAAPGTDAYWIDAGRRVRTVSGAVLPDLDRSGAVPAFRSGTHVLFLDDHSHLVDLDLARGLVQVAASPSAGLGHIGDGLWTLEWQAGGWTIARVGDQAGLPVKTPGAIAGMLARAETAVFGEGGLLRLRLRPLTPDGGPSGVSLTSRGRRLYVAGFAGPEPAAAVPDLVLSRVAGTDAGIEVAGVMLRRDGWFDDRASVGFVAEDPGEGCLIPLRMRNGRVEALHCAGRLRRGLMPGNGGFSLAGGVLAGPKGETYGPLAGGGPLPADQWREARPLGARQFVVIDALGQVWRWNETEAGEVRRVPVGAGTRLQGLAAAGLRLSASNTGVLTVLDAEGGRLADLYPDGRVEAPATGPLVDHPGERGGGLGPVVWSAAEPERGLSFRLRAETENGKEEELPIEVSLAGFSTERERGPVALPGDASPWAEVLGPDNKTALMGPDGTHLVLPADAEAGILARARLVRGFAPDAVAQDFELSYLHASRGQDGWTLALTARPGDPIRVGVTPTGRLTFDEVRAAAAVLASDSGADQRLYLATALEPGLIAQKWGNDGLGMPEPIAVPRPPVRLRTYVDRLYARFGDRDDWQPLDAQGWEQPVSGAGWRFARGARSDWSFDPATRVLRLGETAVEPLLSRDGRVQALVPDVMMGESDGQGWLRVCAAPTGEADLIFRVRTSAPVWYRRDPKRPVAAPVTSGCPEIQQFLEVQAGTAKLSFPRRVSGGEAARYRFSQPGNGNTPVTTSFPFELRAGRLPHTDVRHIRSFGANELLADLADTDGCLRFDAPALRGESDPRWQESKACAPEVVSKTPTPAYTEHRAARSANGRWLRWADAEDSLAWSLADTPDGGGDSLGTLRPDGLPIDRPETVTPWDLAAGGRLQFLFSDGLWSRDLDGGLEAFRREGPFARPQDGHDLVVEPDRGTIGYGRRPPGPDDPVLGSFDAQGRLNRERTLTAAYDPDGRPRRLVLNGGELPLEGLTLVPEQGRWLAPFRNTAAVVAPGAGRLLLFDRASQAFGLWDSENRLLYAGIPPEVRAELRNIWQRGDGAAEALGADGKRRRVTVENADGTTRLRLEVVASPPDTEVLRDAFRLTRDPRDGAPRLVARIAGTTGDELPLGESRNTDPWYQIPGTEVTAAGWLTDQDLILQDRWGLRRVSAARGRHGLVDAAAESRADRLSRHAGDLVLAERGGHIARKVRDVPDPPGFVQQASVEPGGKMLSGVWTVSQSAPDRPVEITREATPGQRWMLGATGALECDRLHFLETAGGRVLFATPGALLMGSGQNSPDELVLAGPQARGILAGPGLALLRTPEGAYRLGAADAGVVLEVPSLRTVERGREDRPYLYFGSPEDWQLYRGDQGLVLIRGIPGAAGQPTRSQTLVGAKIYRGGQFAFDRVEDVSRVEGDVSALQVLTATARERLTVGPDGVPLLLVEDPPDPQGFKYLAPLGEIKYESGRAAAGQRQVRPNPQEPPLPLDALCEVGDWSGGGPGTGREPQGLRVGDRIWLRGAGRLCWIEAGPRWRGPRAVRAARP